MDMPEGLDQLEVGGTYKSECYGWVATCWMSVAEWDATCWMSVAGWNATCYMLDECCGVECYMLDECCGVECYNARQCDILHHVPMQSSTSLSESTLTKV